ncbi:3'-5' exonuclease [Akkermansiaceae bacterium]|nr:3'-5' exonuclease [Akkermansiaceae bacterium]MDA7666911.1 3'-5' exonuclease [Akkermansiaceae bacterium]
MTFWLPRHIKICDAIFTAIDFESAGTAKGKTDSPVQVGLASWSAKRDLHEPFVSFLHCDQKITWAAQKVHGITTEDLLNAPTLLSLWPVLKKQLNNSLIVAHGHGTEKRFLRAFPGHSFGPWIDTLQLARAAWPHEKSHSLGDLCTSLGLDNFCQHAPGKSWHDALYDSLASLALLKHLITQQKLAELPLEVLLHPDTSIWHRSRHQ